MDDLNDRFRRGALELSHLAVVLLASTVTFWGIELEKLWMRKRQAERR